MRSSHNNSLYFSPEVIAQIISQNNLNPEMIADCLRQNLIASRAHLDLVRPIISIEEERKQERAITHTSALLALIYHGHLSD
jgi:hypothetical protein